MQITLPKFVSVRFLFHISLSYTLANIHNRDVFFYLEMRLESLNELEIFSISAFYNQIVIQDC